MKICDLRNAAIKVAISSTMAQTMRHSAASRNATIQPGPAMNDFTVLAMMVIAKGMPIQRRSGEIENWTVGEAAAMMTSCQCFARRVKFIS